MKKHIGFATLFILFILTVTGLIAVGNPQEMQTSGIVTISHDN